jgi:hypothetical protein
MASLFHAYKHVSLIVTFKARKTDVIVIFNSAALLRRPMVAQCGTAAVLFGSGDLIAQQMIEKKGLKGHDVRALVSPILFIPW